MLQVGLKPAEQGGQVRGFTDVATPSLLSRAFAKAPQKLGRWNDPATIATTHAP